MIHASIVRDSRLSAAMMLAFGLAACASGPEEAPAPVDEAAPAPAGPVQSGWTANDGMDAPESVYFDEASGSIFVSQIVGTPDGRDGMGHITRNGHGRNRGRCDVGRRLQRTQGPAES